MLFSYSLQAQVEEQVKDSVKTGIDFGKIEIPNPKSILDSYTYDPVTDRYLYTKSFDGFNINYPLILTPKQYQELMLREQMRAYYQEKSAAIDGKKSGTDAAKKNLLPVYRVNSKLFEGIFGSNTIDIKPTGSVELDLGVRFTKQDNPSLSPQNRTTTTFDFDQRISMSLMGKVGTRLNVNANYDTESTFDFQNLVKLEYTPTEDDIIQKIEVGNVSLPLNSSLIRGAQSLFGVKAQFQFGKTTITGIFSEQKSQTRNVTAQGGGTVQEFDVFKEKYFNDHLVKAEFNFEMENTINRAFTLNVLLLNDNNQILQTITLAVPAYSGGTNVIKYPTEVFENQRLDLLKQTRKLGFVVVMAPGPPLNGNSTGSLKLRSSATAYMVIQ